jgi:hypothetical protein
VAGPAGFTREGMARRNIVVLRFRPQGSCGQSGCEQSSGSHATRRWREMDSNFRFRASSSRLEAEILLLQGAHRRWMAQHGRSSVGLSEPLPENGAKPGFSRRFAMRRA